MELRASNDSTLVAKLRSIGFTDQEARVYMQLLKIQPATGYELSKASGVQRANVYAALDSLRLKGIVHPVSENPLRFIAVPPREVLTEIRNRVNSLVDELQKELEELRVDEGMDVVWLLRGEDAVRSRINELVENARYRILLKARDTHIKPHIEIIRSAFERGVDLHVVLFGTLSISFGNVYLHEGNGLPVGDAADNVILVVDSTEVLMARMQDPAEGAYTQNPSLIHVAETLIRHNIYMTEMMKRLGDHLERTCGPYLIHLRERLLHPSQVARIKDWIQGRGQASSTHESKSKIGGR